MLDPSRVLLHEASVIDTEDVKLQLVEVVKDNCNHHYQHILLSSHMKYLDLDRAQRYTEVTLFV